MSDLKSAKTGKSVLNYIDKLPSERKKEEAIKMMDVLRDITNEEPTMWGPSIIGYGSYTYKLANGKENTFARMAYSPRKTNLVFYVLTNFDGQNELLAELGKHKTGKVCLYINKLADVDFEVLKTILVKSWQHAQKNPGC